MSRSFRLDRGFSLTEMMLTLATAATLAVIGLPIMKDLTVDIKVNEAARAVEREFQDARLRAVSANRPLRVRTNCPVTGQLRSVEYLGDSRDAASNRCSAAAYPFPASDDNILTRPNFDGPIRDLPFGTTVTSTVLEFQPDGTAKNIVSGTPTTIESSISIVVSRSGRTRTVTVNGAGKILLQ